VFAGPQTERLGNSHVNNKTKRTKKKQKNPKGDSGGGQRHEKKKGKKERELHRRNQIAKKTERRVTKRGTKNFQKEKSGDKPAGGETKTPHGGVGC